MSDTPPDFAKVGEQDYFASLNSGEIGIDHLFCYEDFAKPVAFLSERLGRDIKLPERNVSPSASLTLSAELAAELRRKRAQEFALYARILEVGHLKARGEARCSFS